MHKKYFSKPGLLLLALCALHLLANTLWLKLDRSYPLWDQAGHTRIAYNYLDFVTGRSDVDDPLKISSYYPPLIHILSALFMQLVGQSLDAAAFPVTIAFILAIIGLYVLVKDVASSRWAGFFSAAFFSFMMPIYAESRWFLLELPLIASLIWTLVFLYRSRAFDSLQYTLLFGLSTSLLFLVKWTGIVYLIVPLFVALIFRLRLGVERRHYIHGVLVGILLLLLVLPWYASNLSELLFQTQQYTVGEMDDPAMFWSISNFMYYINGFVNLQLGLFMTLSFLVALWFFAKHQKPWVKWVISAYLVFGYLVFTYINNKNGRYTLPLLIAPAVVLGWSLWYSSCLKKKFLTTLLSLCLLLAGIQWIGLSFGLLPRLHRVIELPPYGWISLVNTTSDIVRPPWSQMSTMDAILVSLGERQTMPGYFRVYIGGDLPELNYPSFDIALTTWEFDSVVRGRPPSQGFGSEQEMRNFLVNYDYLLIPTGSVGIPATRDIFVFEQVRDYIIANRGVLYQELEYFPLTNTPGEVLLFKHI